MSDANRPAAKPRRQGFWLPAGEVVGVLALLIAALNYWDSHKQHVEDVRRADAQAQAETRVEAAFVNVGEADRDGRYVSLRPLRSTQAIQSQRYRFPSEVLDHPMEITAERPRIAADWIADGLKRALDSTVQQLSNLTHITEGSDSESMIAAVDSALRDSRYEAAMLLEPQRRRA
jgi:hypothetical protein